MKVMGSVLAASFLIFSQLFHNPCTLSIIWNDMPSLVGMINYEVTILYKFNYHIYFLFLNSLLLDPINRNNLIIMSCVFIKLNKENFITIVQLSELLLNLIISG